MKEALNTYFNVVSKIGIIVVILSSLFLFTNLTTEFYDTPKFVVLLVVTGVLLVLLTLRFTLNNKVVFLRTPLDIPLLLLVTVGIISTLLSSSPYTALLGNQLRVHGSLIAIIALALFYFVAANSLKSKKEINFILFLLTAASAVLSVISLLAFAGVKVLPPPWSHGVNFTPTGSSFSTTAVLALLIPVLVSRILNPKNFIHLVLNSTFLALYGVTIALTGGFSTWVAAALALALSIFFSPLRNFRNLNQLKPTSLIGLVVPLVLVVLVAILSLVPPMGNAQNPIYAQAKNFSNFRELQLDLIPSWKIAVSSFRDSPFWGSGPSTFLFDFTNYKPIEVNSSTVWNLRFDTAFNEYLQVLATLGGVGLIALLSLTALFISSAYPVILAKARIHGSSIGVEDDKDAALAIAGLVFFVVLALHSASLVLWVVGLFLLTAFMRSKQQSPLSFSQFIPQRSLPGRILKMNGEETISVDALPSILLTIALGLILFSFFFGGKFVLADYHHRLALNAASQNQLIPAYNELVVAEKLNPNVDVYRTDLAQINFALANAIAQSKGPTEASPSGSLTEQDQQNIQVLLQQSIAEGRAATQLSPRSALNWEILGLLYRQIAGVAQNALVFSLDSYGQAIFQDPLNPQLRLSVGGVYYAIQNYDLAIRFFTDAINLKPDFANGYYNLSVALRDKGDLNTAQAAAERMLTLIEDKNSQDYKAGSEYLADLKKRIGEKSTADSEIQPPASQTQGALQDNQLPDVVDVGTPPENIATPSAVKRPNSTPEPTPAP